MSYDRGLDVSNYAGAVTVQQFVDAKALGCDFVIVGAQVGVDGKSYTIEQIGNALAAGLEVPAVYELLYWDDRDPQRMQHAMSFGLPVWIDCEFGPNPGALPEATVGRIQAAVAFLGDQVAGIYTGRWWWQPNTRNSEAFKHLPLWHAEYGPRETFSAFDPYGGWRRPAIWQYDDKGVPGLNADLNLREKLSIPAPLEKIDFLQALTSAGEFIRRDWDLEDVIDRDKRALQEVVRRMGEMKGDGT